MEIKEAQEIIRNMESYPSIEQIHIAVGVILSAIKDGYTLCKVESAISGMNGLYTKIEEYATASEVVDDCVEILKEACL